jgi:hypothetical protein
MLVLSPAVQDVFSRQDMHFEPQDAVSYFLLHFLLFSDGA